MFALKKACTASSVSTIPGNHSGLGLNSYVRVTSPLRRYSDLLAHHQIRRFLKHSELLSADELEYVLSISENAASMRHKAERISNEYWTVVYLTQCPMDWSASAFAVYKLDNRFTFLIPEIAYEYKCRLGVEVALGDQRTLKLINADPVTLITKFQIIKNDETSEDEYSEKGAEE